MDSETQASLRGEMLTQIATTQADLLKALSQIGSGDPARVQVALQLANLSALNQRIGMAGAADLQRLQAETMAAIGTAESSADAAAGKASDVDSGKSLAVVTAEARHTAQSFYDDYFEKKKFDDLLVFKSEEDERAYHEREKQRQEEIRLALAEGTPESTALALRLERDQWKDAKAHGADKSPEFQAQGEALDKSSTQLSTAIEANADGPKLPSQADQHIAALKHAGVTVADQSGEGHGVTIDASIAKFLGRS